MYIHIKIENVVSLSFFWVWDRQKQIFSHGCSTSVCVCSRFLPVKKIFWNDVKVLSSWWIDVGSFLIIKRRAMPRCSVLWECLKMPFYWTSAIQKILTDSSRAAHMLCLTLKAALCNSNSLIRLFLANHEHWSPVSEISRYQSCSCFFLTFFFFNKP